MDVFLATQPIFDCKNHVFGCEVLYREGEKNVFPKGKDPNSASGNALAKCFLDVGLSTLSHHTKAFINFPTDFLRNEVATLFPKDQLVIEILEDVRIDKDILEACRRLKEMGYCLAIDDFTFQPGYDELIPLVDIIKVDFKISSPREQEQIVKRFARPGLRFLAEKVESKEEHRRAVKNGYTYFQGYFYAKPVVSHSRKLSPYSHTCIELIRLLHEPEPDMRKVTALIENDVAFSYQLLRLVNSAYFGLLVPISSIPLAVNAIGLEELRKWIYITFISEEKTEDRPDELLRFSIQRGRFMEDLAVAARRPELKNIMMTIGMLSLIDILLNVPMEEVIREMHFPKEVHDVLTGRAGSGFLYTGYELMLCYDNGLWRDVVKYGKQLGITPQDIQEVYYHAIRGTDDFYTKVAVGI